MSETPDLMEPEAETLAANPTEPLALVGIGVCAASLESLEVLFAAIDETTWVAYLIAVRQQEGLSVSAVVDALADQATLPVKVAADGELIEANQVYVGGPDDMITIIDGHLAIRPASEPVGHRGTVDSMLISLAEHAHDRT